MKSRKLARENNLKPVSFINSRKKLRGCSVIKIKLRGCSMIKMKLSLSFRQLSFRSKKNYKQPQKSFSQ